jgi:DNA replication initiation complex subunit (GINS family)
VEEGVSYEALQELLRSERRSNRITPVPPGFWNQLQGFLRAVEDEFRDAQRDDPFSKKAIMLTDRIKNARHAAENVWALRERKLAMLALAHAKDGGQPDGLTTREANLYDKLLRSLQENRVEIFGATRLPPAKVKRAEISSRNEPGEAPEPAFVPEPEPEEEEFAPTVPADKPDEEMVTIRATSDIPPFVGPDMETYLLKQGDLATVPEGIANLLVRRQKASVVAL